MFNVVSFSSVQPSVNTARGGASSDATTVAGKPAQPAQRAAQQDTAEFGAVDYPTVGEYVTKRFDDAMGNVVDGLHGAAEAVPPVLIAEISAIHLKHKREALRQIWNLPMDPQGKWKIKANAILEREEKAASAEVHKLPMVRAFDNVGELLTSGSHALSRGLTWLGHTISSGIKNGFVSAGQLITHGANYVVDGFVSTGVAVGQGIEKAGVAIQNGSRAAGQAVKNAGATIAKGLNDAYDSTVQGVTWLGHQAVELPKAAARGVVGGIGSFGQDLVDFSQRTEPLLQPAN